MQTKLFFVFSLLLLVTLFSFRSQKKGHAADRLLHSNFSEFQHELNELVIAVDTEHDVDVPELRKQFASLRNAYKTVEPLVAHLFPEYVEHYINGAPLLHLERTDSRSTVIQPTGLQVIDELLYEEVVDHKAVKTMLRTLKNDVDELHGGVVNSTLSDQFILEAIRHELVRIFVLGVSGFDTPGSLNALSEATTSLKASWQYINYLEAEIPLSHRKKIIELFESAIKMTDTSVSFNEFDRLFFLKKYINPLLEMVTSFSHECSGTILESRTTAVNPMATNIFSLDFLDPYVFTILDKSEDSEAVRLLGQRLFFDHSLSESGEMSCATCHQPPLAFADGMEKSESSRNGLFVQRNAPTLLNAVYSDRYFYDLRAFTLEQQIEHVIFNDKEFNSAYSAIIARLKEQKKYKKAFKTVFGDGITQVNLSKSLASFVLSLQSFDAPFDQYVRGEVADIDHSVKDGFNLFMGKAACGTCHFPPTFSGLAPPYYLKNESEILGVLVAPDGSYLDTDEGRGGGPIRHERNGIYERSFKTVGIRNAAETAPYFHNGAYPTLRSVIDFYDHGGGAGIGLNVPNQTLSGDSLHLSEQEKRALEAFIRSLSDNPFIRN